MRIDNIIEIVNDLLRKEQKGYRSPDQIVRMLNRGQWRVFNHYRSLYATSIEAKEALAPFLKKLPYGTDAGGVYSLFTTDPLFQGLLGLGIQYTISGKLNYKDVEFPPEDEINSRLGSQLLEPTLTDPIAEMTGFGQFQLYPAGVYAGTVRYLRKPKDVVYAVTQVGRAFTYNDTASVQLEWAEKYQDKVIMAALTLLGVSMTDELVIQVSESLSKIK